MADSADAAFCLPTPLGEVGLWWLDLPDGASRAVRRQWLRQQVAQMAMVVLMAGAGRVGNSH